MALKSQTKLERKLESLAKKERKAFLSEVNRGVDDSDDKLSRKHRRENTLKLVRRYLHDIRREMQEISKSVSIKERQNRCLRLLPRLELCIENLSETAPALATLYANKGKVYSILGFPERAVKGYEKSIMIFDDSDGGEGPPLHYDEIKKSCEEILSLKPSHLMARKKLLELAALKGMVNIPVLEALPIEEFRAVFNYFSLYQLVPQQELEEEFLLKNLHFFLVLEGKVDIRQKGKRVAQVERGGFYGAEHLVTREEVDYGVKALARSLLLTITKYRYQEACSYSPAFKKVFEEATGISTQASSYENRASDRFPLRSQIMWHSSSPPAQQQEVHARDISTSGIGLVTLTPPNEGETFIVNLPLHELPAPIQESMLNRVGKKFAPYDKESSPMLIQIIVQVDRVYRQQGKNVYRVGASFISEPWVE